ncbi:transposase [Siminovitchia fortis]|uniref:Transposase n=1 Tax=Siminovitchia fortis TaxID=254758 RepID=A0A443IUX0_9BACI|nr:transposase [Siminovitchia fortis]RWR11862.1 transposase [Siminovitchia fortis]WHY81858.1 transposase [Siminovitchia fortis]
MEEVKKLPEADEIFELPISYEEKGKLEGKREVARRMLNKGLSVNLIAEVTQLNKEEIEKLRKEL